MLEGGEVGGPVGGDLAGVFVVGEGLHGVDVGDDALGFGEGATFPGGLRAVVQTLRPTEQARGIAVAYSGGSLGAIVTPIIVAFTLS